MQLTVVPVWTYEFIHVFQAGTSFNYIEHLWSKNEKKMPKTVKQVIKKRSKQK